MNAHAPTTVSERIELLDLLRGFALFGILFVNMTWFTGYAVIPDQWESFSTWPVDRWVYWLIHILVDAKFWSMFALLFGIGVAIQYQRAQKTKLGLFNHMYVRRVLVLLLIGLAHAIFLWFGDIVSLYAAVGLVLLFFRDRSERTIFVWSICLLLAPIALLAVWLWIYQLQSPPEGATDPGHGPAELFKYFAGGSYSDVLAANWVFLKERWLIALYDGRFFKLAGMFLLGWWIGKQDLLLKFEKYRWLWWRILGFGLVVGLPLNVLIFSCFEGVTLRPPSAPGLLVESLKAIGVPALCLGYVAGLVLIYPRIANTTFVRLVTAPGRMSLTNYVMHSVIGVIVFYGYGFGYWADVSVTWSLAVILVIFLGQMLFSHWWLQQFRQGPLEWIWRCLTYARWLPLRRDNSETD